MPTDSGFRRWLVDWFGFSRKTENGDPPVASSKPEQDPMQKGPLFSLGDTKQDVVVSYRAAQSDEV